MIRCHGFGHGGSARSASASPAPLHLLLRLRVGVRVPLPPPSPWSRLPSLALTRYRLRVRQPKLPVLQAFAAERQRTSPRIRRSSMPLQPWKLRPPLRLRLCALLPRRLALPRLPLPRQPCTSRRQHPLQKRLLPPKRVANRPPRRTRPPLLQRCRRRRALRRSPVLRRPRQCRSRTPALRRPRRVLAERHPRRVRRSVRRRPVSPIAHARPAPVSRLAVAPVRVADTAVVRALWHRPRRHSAGRPSVRQVPVRRVPLVVRRLRVVPRARVAIRAAAAGRRGSVARWIRRRSMRTSRRR